MWRRSVPSFAEQLTHSESRHGQQSCPETSRKKEQRRSYLQLEAYWSHDLPWRNKKRINWRWFKDDQHGTMTGLPVISLHCTKEIQWGWNRSGSAISHGRRQRLLDDWMTDLRSWGHWWNNVQAQQSASKEDASSTTSTWDVTRWTVGRQHTAHIASTTVAECRENITSTQP